jgi:phosphatidylinositol glycan class O
MYAISAWGFFCITSFYGTGHQATISGIQWQAAFVGTTGEFASNLLPGLMVTVSTFSSHVLLGVSHIDI